VQWMQARVGPNGVDIRAFRKMNATEHNFGNRPRRRLFESMMGFLDKARDWRRRAAELRGMAERMMTPAARNSLLDRAASLDHHAENIEQVTAKFREMRGTAAAGRDSVPRRRGRGQGQD
jgi:hypothetical protein